MSNEDLFVIAGCLFACALAFWLGCQIGFDRGSGRWNRDHEPTVKEEIAPPGERRYIVLWRGAPNIKEVATLPTIPGLGSPFRRDLFPIRGPFLETINVEPLALGVFRVKCNYSHRGVQQ